MTEGPQPDYAMPAQRKKRRRWIWPAVTAVALLAGVGIGASNGSSDKASADAKPAVMPMATITVTASSSQQPSVVTQTAVEFIGPSPTATVTVTASAQPTTAPPTKPPAATKAATKAATGPKTLLTVNGSGIKTTQSFTAPSSWQIAYSYDCTSFGYAGNFVVDVYRGSDYFDSAANALAMKGSDISYMHQSGTFYLDVNSECDWHITVSS